MGKVYVIRYGILTRGWDEEVKGFFTDKESAVETLKENGYHEEDENRYYFDDWVFMVTRVAKIEELEKLD